MRQSAGTWLRRMSGSHGAAVRSWLRVSPRRWLTRLLALSAVIGSITVVVGAGIYVAHTFHEKFLWRNDEYAKLRSLKAGFNLPYFRSVLGSPVFKRTRKTGYTESTFRGHGYWVQTLSYRGIVKLYAVTACENAFHPTFTIPGWGFQVELNRSTFTDVLRTRGTSSSIAQHGVGWFDYRFSGATVSSWFYETMGGANPGYYKYYLWGIDDACPDWYGQYEGVAYQAGKFPGSTGRTSKKDSVLQNFRRLVTVNTYAETAPGVFIIQVGRDHPNRPSRFAHFHGFQIGVDRLLVRTTE